MNGLRLNTKLLSSLHNVLLMQAADLRNAVGIARSTWYDILSKHDTITVQHLLSIANGLHIPVRRFFSTGSADIIGTRDDYIAEPYKECYYLGEVLRDAINDRQDATWRRAGEVAGMTYQHVQKSLSSETRTPVVRFLAVCEAFDIDPFTILVDPNPEPVPERKRKPRRNDPVLLSEITALREGIGRLGATVEDVTRKYDDLLSKYDQLLTAHRALLDRFNQHVREGFVSMAADPQSEPEPDKPEK